MIRPGTDRPAVCHWMRANGLKSGVAPCRKGPNSEVATTRLLSSNWSSARSYLCNGDAGDREQPTDNQLWGHTVAKEQHA
jgi:hypothetical protein